MNEPYRSDGFIQTTVNKYAHTVAKTAFAYLKNTADAEDITQEVFLSLMQKNPLFENEEHLKAWLIRVAINKSKNHLKSGWFKSNNRIPDELPYLSQEQSDLLSEVLALDLKYRLPIHLYYYEGYTIKEIAKILGEKEATVGTRLARGRSLLKKSLGGVNDE
ncbi:MAG: sigma-70 family RNA polymerase sigma factor [Eubacteriales bacterium]